MNAPSGNASLLDYFYHFFAIWGTIGLPIKPAKGLRPSPHVRFAQFSPVLFENSITPISRFCAYEKGAVRYWLIASRLMVHIHDKHFKAIRDYDFCNSTVSHFDAVLHARMIPGSSCSMTNMIAHEDTQPNAGIHRKSKRMRPGKDS